jgi:PhzF family phenazine biosynthesis protein
MNLPIYWVDAFTEKTFGGNPAAVIPLDSWLEDSLLQKIASENGLSETAFFIRTGSASADLRWFTPGVEVDLCGHATLATAHVLFNELGQAQTPFVFKARSGLLSISRKGPMLELDFPSRPSTRTQPPADLLKGLGIAPKELFLTETAWLCVYDTEDEVRALCRISAPWQRSPPGSSYRRRQGRTATTSAGTSRRMRE